MRIIWIFCLIVILFVNLILASPPNLPAIVYGKIVSDKGIGIANLNVKATWKDSLGITRSITTKTSDNKANMEAGNYKFEIYDIDEGEEINIDADNNDLYISASLGIPIKVKDISVEETKGFFGSIVGIMNDIFANKNESESEKDNSTEEQKEENKSIDNQVNGSLTNNTGISFNNESFNDSDINNHKNISYNFTRPAYNTSSPIINKIPDNIILCQGESLMYRIRVNYSGTKDLDYYLNEKENMFVVKPTKKEDVYQEFTIYSKAFDKNFGDIWHGYQVFPIEFAVSDGTHADVIRFNVTVISINHAPEIIETSSVRTIEIKQGQEYNINIRTYDPDDKGSSQGKLNFNIKSGNEKNIFSINDLGVLRFNPKNKDIGNYRLNICVKDEGVKNPHKSISKCGQDGKPIEICKEFYISLTLKDNPPTIVSIDPKTEEVFMTQPSFRFMISKKDDDGTSPQSYWYIDNELAEIHDPGNYDEYTYKLYCERPAKKIRVDITDGLYNDSYTWGISYDNKACFQSFDKLLFFMFYIMIPLITLTILFLITKLFFRYLSLKRKLEDLTNKGIVK